MANYRVRQGMSIIGPDQVHYVGGEGLPDTWDPSIYKNLLAEPVPPIEQATVELPDTVVVSPLANDPSFSRPPLPGKDSSQDQGAMDVRKQAPVRLDVPTNQPPRRVTITEPPQGNTTPPDQDESSKPAESGKTAISIWNLDPATLDNKTLDELNVMVIERDAKLEPFTDKAEAAAWLSQDYVG